MADPKKKLKAKELINKDKWWDMLSRMIDVLQINLFIVDDLGQIVLPPEESRFGGKLIVGNFFDIDFLAHQVIIPEAFKKYGKYFEYETSFGLKLFALPIVAKERTIAYLIAGPLILNRRPSIQESEDLAARLGVDSNTIVDQFSTLRVTSNVMINSILDLLSEVLNNTVALTLTERVLEREENEHLITHAQKLEAEEIYARVGFDEMLITLLDVALKMTDTECGSIMLLDEANNVLMVKAARGLKSEVVNTGRTRLGEGIAGIAAEHNESYFIRGVESNNNRIAHLLKRGDIKNALVMPLVTENRVFGVLNLHTKRENDKLESNIENLQYLSQLISSDS